MLPHKQLFQPLVVVVKSAKSNNNWVEFIVLLDVSKNKSAINTILFEFIFFTSFKQKNNIYIYYAINNSKIHAFSLIIIYVQTLLLKGGLKMEVLLDRRLQSMVKEYVPQGEILDDLVCFFSIFSDYTRLKMISALAISEMCVSDISCLLSLNQTTVSHQLRLLKNLNAVTTRRQGKVVFYSLRNEVLNDVLLKGVEFLGY